MLQSLQRIGKELGRDLAQGWESLAEGWRELLSRSANALTRFTQRNGKTAAGEVIPADAPRWSLLAGDVVDTGAEVVVRVEMPGVDKRDCEISIEGETLYVRGEKRFDSTYVAGAYHVRQCAFGAFQRALPLPDNIDPDRADARFHNGVLVVRLPKLRDDKRRRISIN